MEPVPAITEPVEINMKKLLIILSLTALLAIPLGTTAEEITPPPENTTEGLKLVPRTGEIDLVWMKPGIDLPQYKQFYLVEPYVAFRKNWQKDQNRGHPSLRVKASDMDRIKADIKQLLMEILTEELLAGGYTFSEVRAEDVLIIKPAILDLDVYAPDLLTTADTLTDSAGSMTLYLEIYDSVTEALLVKAVDRAQDSHAGSAQWQSRVANRAAARRMMTPWAKALISGLNSRSKSTW
jgi:hypothetical protein